MTDAQLVALVISGLFLVIVAVSLALLARRGTLEQELLRLSDAVGLGVPLHLEEELLRHIRRRRLAWTLGMSAGVLGVMLPVSLFSPEGLGALGAGGGAIGFCTGAAAFIAVTLIDRRRTSLGTPAVARIDRAALTDFVAPRLVATAVIAVGAALLAAVLLLPFDSLDSDAVPLAVIAAVGLAAWFVVARAIAGRRPISGDTATLAWSDALRAVSLRDLLALPALSALLALISSVPMLSRAAFPGESDVAASVAGTGSYAALAVGLVIALLWFSRRTARHYRRRLWPEFTEGRA